MLYALRQWLAIAGVYEGLDVLELHAVQRFSVKAKGVHDVDSRCKA